MMKNHYDFELVCQHFHKDVVLAMRQLELISKMLEKVPIEMK